VVKPVPSYIHSMGNIIRGASWRTNSQALRTERMKREARLELPPQPPINNRLTGDLGGNLAR